MEQTQEDLTGRVALVTGGGRGIGRAIAEGLASAGVRVGVLARSVAELDQTVATIDAQGGQSVAVPADVAEPDQLARALTSVERRWGPVEILINNAAVVWPVGTSAKIAIDEWAAALAVNVTAPARLTFRVLPAMIAAGWGRVVNVSSSIAAHPAGMLRANAYATTKTALEAHTLNLAAELSDTGVTINVYRPGGVDTAMQAFIRGQDPAQIGAALHERFVRNHDGGTLLTPRASAASLLARIPGAATGQIWDATDPLPSGPTPAAASTLGESR